MDGNGSIVVEFKKWREHATKKLSSGHKPALGRVVPLRCYQSTLEDQVDRLLAVVLGTISANDNASHGGAA